MMHGDKSNAACRWLRRIAVCIAVAAALVLASTVTVSLRVTKKTGRRREAVTEVLSAVEESPVDWDRMAGLVHRSHSFCWSNPESSLNGTRYRPPFTALIISGMLRSLPDPVMHRNIYHAIIRALHSNVVVFLALADKCDADGFSNDFYPCTFRRSDIGPMLSVLRPANVSWDEDLPPFHKCPPLDRIFFPTTIRMQMKRRRGYEMMRQFEDAHGIQFSQVIVTTTDRVFVRPFRPVCEMDPSKVWISTAHWDWVNVVPRPFSDHVFGILNEYVSCRPPFSGGYEFMETAKQIGVLPEPWLKSWIRKKGIQVQEIEFHDVALRPHSAKLLNGRHGARWWVNYCGSWHHCGNKDIMDRGVCMDVFYRGYTGSDLDSLPCSHRNSSYGDCCDGLLRQQPWDKDNEFLIRPATYAD